jgi:hypothetical protein
VKCGIWLWKRRAEVFDAGLICWMVSRKLQSQRYQWNGRVFNISDDEISYHHIKIFRTLHRFCILLEKKRTIEWNSVHIV